MNKVMSAFRNAMQREYDDLINNCVQEANDILLDNDNIIKVVIKNSNFSKFISIQNKEATHAGVRLSYNLEKNELNIKKEVPRGSHYNDKEKALIYHMFHTFERIVESFNRS